MTDSVYIGGLRQDFSLESMLVKNVKSGLKILFCLGLVVLAIDGLGEKWNSLPAVFEPAAVPDSQAVSSAVKPDNAVDTERQSRERQVEENQLKERGKRKAQSHLDRAAAVNEEAYRFPDLRFSVMAYNVENLFDTVDDEGKQDETYLPLDVKKRDRLTGACRKIRHYHYRRECEELDWSTTVLDRKLAAISRVILAYNRGKGADIVILAEVENKRVLEMLQQRLSEASYMTAKLLEGPDQRGIDVAVLSRFPQLVPASLHPVALPGSRSTNTETRSILQVNLRGPGEAKVSVFGVHFPSQANPFHHRQRAFEVLNDVAGNAAQESDIVLAGGDFNVTGKEDGRLFRGLAGPWWTVSHHVGCKACRGSHFYSRDKSWSFLDAIMLWKGHAFLGKPGQPESAAWHIEPESVGIFSQVDGQVDGRQRPRRFHAGGDGFSDHLPVTLSIVKRWIPGI